ncbi:hypothetical protein Nepgr_012747 [Nepenthes gracilis]|uniref:ENHANCER OF AG-4 protein 2 n=1 Tax=Nepenthes gracilis TaxID=150966 RepID=A0AAD3XNN0_NEPGR|nr:hypothetical protein Nepgr_012747 [Nepenthes gracilis]
MVPGRSRGVNKSKTTKELSFGDLVLAKVKGFPAWPAKVSRPEDWERAPDPKKYFVQFFGTQEIAFVAPLDIQAFTSETKSKLLTRCQGKTVKYFAQAVKEICEAFEVLQEKKSSSLNNDSVQATNPCDASTIGGVKIDGSDKESVFPCEQCTSRKHSDDGVVENAIDSKYKQEDSSTFSERIESARASSSSPYSGLCAVNGNSHRSLEGGKRDDSISFVFGGQQKSFTEVRGMKKLDIGSKRKLTAVGHNEDTVSSGHLKGKKPRKITSCGSNRESSPYTQRFRGKIVKNLLKNNKPENVSKDSQKDAVVNSKERSEFFCPGQKKSGQLGHVKKTLGANDRSHPFKWPKHVELVNESTKGSILKNGKSDASGSNVTDRKLEENAEIEGLMQVKAEIESGTKAKKGKFESHTLANEPIPALARFRRRELEVMSDPNVSISENEKNSISAVHKNDVSKKRRAIRLYDEDDDDDKPKTPVHGRSAAKVNASLIPDFKKNSNSNYVIFKPNGQGLEGPGRGGDSSPKECIMSAKSIIESSSPATLLRTAETSNKTHFFGSPRKLDPKKQLFKDTMTVLVSPKKSPQVVPVSNNLVEEQKTSSHAVSPKRSPPLAAAASKVVEEKVYRYTVNISDTGNQSKSLTMYGKGSHPIFDRLNFSPSQVSTKKSKQLSSGEKPKGTPQMKSQFIGLSALAENQMQNDSTAGGRLDDLQKEKNSLLADNKATDSVMSLKHLIAAARHAQMHNLSHGNANAIVPTANIQGTSPSPSPTRQFSFSGAMDVMQLDAQGTQSRTSLISPSGHAHQFASQIEPDAEDHEDRSLGSGLQAASVGSLSGGTEAAVARDAFEGMIETLSRTKESIGRATRLAVDCAKYGIANEVVDLLIHKLETETSLHRRVDLFFLVDSITQCSHSQKGIAGASYIPAVQEALPRLLGAAAPPGVSARENRRQCLKVLRLWLERKILPESSLRHYMDDIRDSKDDSSSVFSLRRPSRAERAVDDPIREMEGMFDEYGSNATFQLPGFLSSSAFDDDDEDVEDPGTSCKEAVNASPMEPAYTFREAEIGIVTPNDRRHVILEDVDGELEMEEDPGHQKDDRLLSTSGFGIDMGQQCLERELFPATNDSTEASSTEGSPPLPLEPPPPVPSLPSSPPPPSPPPLSPSPPPPPPPPPPLPSSFPLLLPSHPPPPYMQPAGPSQSKHLPPSLMPQGPQSAFPSYILPQPPASLLPSSPQLAYQMPVPYEFCGISTHNQHVKMVGNPMGQSASFAPAGIAGPQDSDGFDSSRPLELGHKDMYVSSQAAQTNQHFQPSHAPFAHGPFQKAPPLQTPVSHFPYNKPTGQQHLQILYPHPSSSSSLPSGQAQYVADEQWIASSGEYKSDNQHGTWMNGGKTPSCSSTPFGREGYFQPAVDRPPSNSMGFPFSSSNPLSTVALASGNVLKIYAWGDFSKFVVKLHEDSSDEEIQASLKQQHQEFVETLIGRCILYFSLMLQPQPLAIECLDEFFYIKCHHSWLLVLATPRGIPVLEINLEEFFLGI